MSPDAGNLTTTPRRLTSMTGPIRFDLTSLEYQLYVKLSDHFLNQHSTARCLYQLEIRYVTVQTDSGLQR